MELTVPAHAVLLLLFAAAVLAQADYFAKVRTFCGDTRAYYKLLTRDSIRWLPLIFIIVPVAAVLLDYSGGVDFAIAAVYFLAIAADYGLIRPGLPKERSREKTGRSILLPLVPWIPVCAAALLLPWEMMNAKYVLLAAAFIAQPSFTALMRNKEDKSV